ncbi:pre-mRNA-processing factor 17 [Fistulifera solaris]|uniref:Pre-mRNA-processing factor 17 n=1 Tax=Fistulifera solaris TaxID=1519565 RepID=A0A1Z5JDA7_FISSO|nr:pre-mRNA-processing factor 17 [Fistulifera solaris]|eukprot:GAX11758.1 pre-mRNA-processing factor 17 [Fistulifera solaris]
MDLLDDASSVEEDAETNDRPSLQRPDRRYLNAAPSVQSTALTVPHLRTDSTTTNKRKKSELILYDNPQKSVLYQPLQGPIDPTASHKQQQQQQQANDKTTVAFDNTAFQQQRTTFARTGQALAPEGHVMVRTTLGYDAHRLEQWVQQEQTTKRPKIAAKQDDVLVQGSDDEAEYGVWGPPGVEEEWMTEHQLSDMAKGEPLAPQQLAERAYIQERNRQRGLEEEAQDNTNAFERLVERKMAHLLPPQKFQETPIDPCTTFHAAQEYDYKGRSWIAPPAGQSTSDAPRCFVPKKCSHRFMGHSKGVHRIRLFPKTGHLLLSAGLDGKCMVWSVTEKILMRTYEGHSAGVRDVQFNHNGNKFVSASFDRYLRLWDTESGQVLNTFTNKKVPYVVQFYPHDDNFFVVGCSDNKIVTYDVTTGQITQEYNHHLAPVNAIVFVEDQGTTKMVTSSDDKKILVWEWDIGVPVKYISDPTMHSMPCLVLHPTEPFFVGQSLDNTITVFQAGNRFSLQKKRKFSGHVVSGYACEMAFSTDGQFLVSGDGTGSLFIWDWKKHRILQRYKAHSRGPAICCAWHPREPSTVFTCGWDGVIKMWT